MKRFQLAAALSLLLLTPVLWGSPPSGDRLPPLNDAQMAILAQRIWMNEGAGKQANLTVWNRGEAFPSFGIGHFIWYPAGIEGPFQESFPALLAYLVKQTSPPRWLLEQKDAPWHSRAEFYSDINSPHMHQLRSYLTDTMPLQMRFIVSRMDGALPKMIASLKDDNRRRQITRQFYRVAGADNGLYALIDYTNFKGEGTSLKERYEGEGWGLLQVLETMDPKRKDVMEEFVRAADKVLSRRVANAPRDESRWLPGWRKRLSTYLKPTRR